MQQDSLDLLSISQAAEWASGYVCRKVTPSNISYLIQYARIHKVVGDGDVVLVSKAELARYYDRVSDAKRESWSEKLGDVDWGLSFAQVKEADRTKHVHRLHQYKGKFIPQLVAYFLDEHTDGLKRDVFFHPNDIVLDPFCGSGTTLVQANELNINAVGVDISAFNALTCPP